MRARAEPHTLTCVRAAVCQIMMYNMDHIKQAGYYLEVFIENVPNGIINPE